MAKQIGFYNQTHKHGEPLENLIQKLKARRGGGEPNRSGITRDPSLAPEAAGWNRQNAPVGPVPNWVAQQMGQTPMVPRGGIPEGVTPTKPVQNPLANYPIRRPQSVNQHYTPPVNRKRRLPSWMA